MDCAHYVRVYTCSTPKLNKLEPKRYVLVYKTCVHYIARNGYMCISCNPYTHKYVHTSTCISKGSSHACEKEVKVDITAVALQRYGLVDPLMSNNHTAFATLSCDIKVSRMSSAMGTW